MTLDRAKARHVLAKLLNGRTAAGGNVVPTQITKWDEDELPAIGVYTLRGDDERKSDAPQTYLTTVHVVIELVVRQRWDTTDPAHPKPIGEVDDDLDALSQEVENLVLRDPTLGGIAQDLRSAGFEIASADDGRRGVLGERKRYEVDLYSEPCQGDPTRVYDLKNLSVRFDLPSEGETTTPNSPTQDGGIDIKPAP